MHPLALRFFSLASALLLASTAALAQLQSIPAEGLAQIQAHTAEKQNRTPAEAKLSSQLLHAMRTLAGRPAVPGLSGTTPGVEQFIADRVAADNTVQVTIQGDINPSLLEAIAHAGGSQIDPYPQFGRVTARLPIGSLLAVSARDDVRSIRPLDRAHTNRYVPTDDERRTLLAAAIAQGIPNGPIGNSGTSQGFHAHGADLAVATGIDGTGVKICVLSDGVDSLATLQAAGQLPAVDVVAGQDGHHPPDVRDEGTAMLQIVHDMAPNAALGFATAFTSDASFAANIVTLRNAPHNCDIIVDDVTYFEESAFQDGIIAQAVNTVTAAGALYFSSAANSGNLTHATKAGTWEGDFVSAGAAGPPLSGAGTLHNFGGSTFDTLTTRGSVVILEWSDPLGASGNDYDLYILNSAGTAVLTSSTSFQNGTQDPVEGVSCSASLCPTNARVVVVLFSGTTRALRVDTERGTMTIVTAGNTFGHNAAGSALTAAATAIGNAGGGLFTGGVADPVETYSSDGPRKIFYTPAGAAITPGNVLFGTNGGTTLAKVDLTAADCTHSFVTGFEPFCGTSAAAPHAAAIAGLIKSAKTGLTNAQIKTALLSSALDIEAAGTDRDSGVGIVMANTAVKSVLTPLTVGKSFVPNLIASGGTSVLTITLNNANTVAIKGVAFTDTYPANLVNSATPNPNITGAGCTGTLTATAGGSNVALTSGTVPAGITCTYKVTVTSSVVNTYLDGTGAVTTPIALNSSAASASLTVGIAPAITSANNTTLTSGVFGTFTVTTTGTPVAAISKTGTLPAGVTFVDNGNGTATLSGTPGPAGSFPLTITANNGLAPNATQAFTLTVNVGSPASVTVSSGSGQSTRVGTALAQPLVALVRDSGGNPVPNVTVTWTAPVSAASATFNVAPSTMTNGSGLATIAVTANSISGAYAVLAHVGGLSASFNLTNSITIAAGGTCGGNGATNADLVEQYYTAILHRASEAGGKAFWTGEADRLCALGADPKQTFVVMANVFFNTPEYLALNRDDNGFVNDLYITFFGRLPEPGGLTYWLGQLSSGIPRNNVMSSFLFSAEFTTTMNSLFPGQTARAETYLVLNLYGGLFRRLAETGGYTYWTGQFRTAQCNASPAAAVQATIDSVSSQFLASAEYAARGTTNSQYVVDLYYALLQRGAETAGYNYWVGQLNGSLLTREQMRQQFLTSPEMQAQSAAIAAQGCLP